MTKVIFTVGVSASGKSTWAHEQNAWVICRDDIRHQLCEKKKAKGYVAYGTVTNIWKAWNWKWEGEVTDIWWKEFADAIYNQLPVVICADTNLNRGRINAMKERMIREFGVTEFEEKVFDVSFAEACRRDALRPDGVGYQVIAKQYKEYQKFIGRRMYEADPMKDRAVIFDIDGTLATMVDRGAFEWDKVGTDAVRREIRDMARGFYATGYEIIIVSGRDGVCYDETVKWLENHSVPFSKFFIRPAGDMRDDRIIKEEIFWRDIEPHYDVKLVVDDRPKVCRMWRELGLSVAAVADPYMEF